jgi:KRAB domain-containing zinc finger protein
MEIILYHVIAAGQTMPCKAGTPRIYKCYFCNMKSTAYPVINDHIRKKHPNSHKTLYKCDYIACLHLYFNSEEEKNTHREEQHSSNRYGKKVELCIYCGKVFMNSKNLGGHMAHAHKNIVVRCNYLSCSEYLKSEADRQQHLEEKHQFDQNKKYCIYCDKWVTHQYLETHVSRCHKNVAIKCNYPVNCFTYFRSESDRDDHIKSVHLQVNVDRNVVCKFCGTTCSKEKSLALHIRKQHKHIIKCNFSNRCGEYFETRGEYEKHFQENHLEKEKSKKILCPKCSYKTDKNHYLVQHFELMHGKERIKCPQCPASNRLYKSEQALQRHLHMIHAEKIVCPHCKQSVKKRYLPPHLKSETCLICKNNFPCRIKMEEHKKLCKRKCEICQTEFLSTVPLLTHVTNDHKDIDLKDLEWLGDLRQNLSKSFKCKKCNSCFFNKAGLCHHVRIIHEKERPILTCFFCNKEYKFKYQLEKHIISMHIE